MNFDPPKPPYEDEQVCDICGKPLASETWTDDETYGDVHERCLREKEGE